MAAAFFQSNSLNRISSPDVNCAAADTSIIFGSQLRILEINRTLFRSINFFGDSTLTLKALREPLGLSQENPNYKQIGVGSTEKERDLFSQMKHRFLSFKKHIYMENLEHFQNLATDQFPKVLIHGVWISAVMNDDGALKIVL